MKLKTFKLMYEDKEIELAVIKPSAKVIMGANRFYSKAFSEALSGGALLKIKLDTYLKQQGVWDEEKEKEFIALRDDILNKTHKLNMKGIKLNDAKRLALEMIDLRAKMRDLIADKNITEANTAESQADNAKFNYLVMASVVYNDTGKVFFKDYEDFLERQNEISTIKICKIFADLYYDLDDDYENKLPEFEFLKKYKFIDEKRRLLNKEGKLVDREGRYVDEEGRYIKYKEDGGVMYVNLLGHELTEKGELKVNENACFLDDDGKPIQEPLMEDKK